MGPECPVFVREGRGSWGGAQFSLTRNLNAAIQGQGIPV